MTTNGNPPPDEMPIRAEDITDFEVGTAMAGDREVVLVQLIARNESGHSSVFASGWLEPEVALRLSHGIRDIAVELLS